MPPFVQKYLFIRVTSTLACITIMIANWWLWRMWPGDVASIPAPMMYRALIYGFQVFLFTWLGFMIAESVSRFWWNRWKPIHTSAVQSNSRYIQASTRTITGTLHESGSCLGTGQLVIASHGINDTQARAWHWAQGLAAAGFTVFTWEYRGRGQSKGRITDLQGHVDDLAALIDHWHQQRTRAGLPDPRVHLVGWSLGGAVSIIAGLDNPRVARIVAWSTWSRLSIVLRRIYANPVATLRYAIKRQLLVPGKEGDRRFSPAVVMGEMQARMGEVAFTKLTREKLFLCHAADDRLVPVSCYHENCAAASLPTANHALFQKGSHLLLRREPDVLGMACRFFTKREGGTP